MAGAAVIIAKTDGASKKEIDALGKKVAKLTSACIYNWVQIVDTIAISGNLKEAIERVEELAEARKINYLVIATKKDIANNEAEYNELFEQLLSIYGVRIILIK